MGHAVAERPSTGRRAWLNVGVAALLMVATLPGRSHGLGLLTEPILRDFPLSRLQFGQINLWASLLGALFCLPCGWLIDRIGLRAVMIVVLLGLGGAVIGMSGTNSIAVLAILILLTRGFGQSALSVVSLGVVGKTSLRNREMAMGAFAVMTGVGMAAAFGGVQAADTNAIDWRVTWAVIGLLLVFAVAPASAALLTEPRGQNLSSDSSLESQIDFTLAEALRTPAFWAVALNCAFFLLVSSGTGLFYEDILAEFGFSRTDYESLLLVSFLLGTMFNLVCGWAARQWSMPRLLASGTVVLAGSLVMLPYLRALPQLYAYAVAGGFASGAVTVVFFTIWRPLFGARHLGKIQGAAQMLTVLGSALSQALFPLGKEWFGSYIPLLRILAGVAVVLALWVCFVPPPRRQFARRGQP
jgi:MFS family permease